MNNQNNFFKSLSIFLIGLILGFMINKIPFSSPAISSISTTGSDKVIGNTNAPITIVEYSDFQCPLCKQFFDQTLPTIQTNYIDTGKVKLVYKQFPLNIHPQAPAAALASECALEQNKFWEMHDSLFQNQAEWSGNTAHLDIFTKLAGTLGLDQNKFSECLNAKKYNNNITKDYQEGLAKGINGTPTFYINDQPIIGAQATSVFTNTIDSLLNN